MPPSSVARVNEYRQRRINHSGSLSLSLFSSRRVIKFLYKYKEANIAACALLFMIARLLPVVTRRDQFVQRAKCALMPIDRELYSNSANGGGAVSGECKFGPADIMLITGRRCVSYWVALGSPIIITHKLIINIALIIHISLARARARSVASNFVDRARH